MKIKKKVATEEVTKNSRQKRNRRPTTEVKQEREQFLDLEPLDFLAQKDSVMICPKNRRPYLSKMAMEQGIDYLTLPLGENEILVIRYKINQKGNKK